MLFYDGMANFEIFQTVSTLLEDKENGLQAMLSADEIFYASQPCTQFYCRDEVTAD